MPRAASSLAGRPRHHGPPVHSLPRYASAYQGRRRTTARGRRSPRHEASDHPSIKAGASPRECCAAQCNCQSAAGPPWPPPRDPLLVPSSTAAQPLHTSSSPIEAFRAAHSFAPTATTAGAGGTAANTGRRRRATPPAQPPLQTPTEIKPRDPSSCPPPAPGRSSPPVRRNLAGPPPAGARGLHCKPPILCRILTANREYICEESEVPGACS
jgi:hypothetical protein